MRLFALIAGLCILGGATYLTFQWSEATELGFEGGQALDLANVFLVAGLMLFGLIFGCLFRQLSGQHKAINLLTELKIVFTSSSFLSALCVSPFVFMSVYAVVKGSPGDPASMLLAFQNGFFCESVFSKLFPNYSNGIDSSKSATPG